MIKKRKKLFKGLLTLMALICMAVAGCGKKQETEQETQTASPSEAAQLEGTYYSESEDATYEFDGDGTVVITAPNGVSAEGTYDREEDLITFVIGGNILTYQFKQTDTGFELSSQDKVYVYTRQKE